MKALLPFSLLLAILWLGSCDLRKKNTEVAVAQERLLEEDSIVFRFSFSGCNRVNKSDVLDSVPSTANKYVLDRIFNELSTLERTPEIFFFLGDLVLGKSTNEKLNTQLKAWVSTYQESAISTSGIEMIAVPGNHELLHEIKRKKKGKKKKEEVPLYGSSDIWLKHMEQFMPLDRDTVASSKKMDNRLTYAFVRKDIAFIVMNTDSFNPPTKKNKFGKEGMLPNSWVMDKLNDFKANKNIKHIFVLGHKPYYVNNKTETGHGGLPSGPQLWPAFQEAGVTAMLSAHKHDYQRWQPINKALGGGTYQIIAGNGGSQGDAPFFGYSTISIMASGQVKLRSVGFCKGDPYYTPVPSHKTSVRDEVILTWEKNENTYPSNYKECN